MTDKPDRRDDGSFSDVCLHCASRDAVSSKRAIVEKGWQELRCSRIAPSSHIQRPSALRCGQRLSKEK